VGEMLQSLPDGAAQDAVAKIECGPWTDNIVR